ncbi:MAG: hypothetical protein HN348_06450 [Proteobacteria bacterium]|nr:hypothetical protein [Pseudomonadota bacterium]
MGLGRRHSQYWGRGYSYTASRDMKIPELFVPQDVSEEVQHIQVVRISNFPSDFDPLFWQAKINEVLDRSWRHREAGAHSRLGNTKLVKKSR